MARSPPKDGRITSLPSLTGALSGSEVMYIVSPGTEQAGVSFQITTTTLAAFFAAFPFLNTTEVTSGATYNALTTDTRILVNKTLGSATSIIFPNASLMQYPLGIFVKDQKGDAGTNPITITFSAGQLCDGLSSLVINNPYGWVQAIPVPGGTAWYQSQ